MSDFGLLSISATAFVGVYLLLGILAGMMKILMTVFPATEVSTSRTDSVDSAVIAAISSTAATAFPGGRVTKIEEIQ